MRLAHTPDDGPLRGALEDNYRTGALVGRGDPQTNRSADARHGLGIQRRVQPRRQAVAAGGFNYEVRVWDAATGEPVGQPMTGRTGSVWSVAYSPDGKRIASASDDFTVRLWDTDTGQPVGGPLRGHTQTVKSVAFSPDGNFLVSGGYDKTLRLWLNYPDAASGLCAKLPANMSRQQWRDWVSPDIGYIAACPGTASCPVVVGAVAGGDQGALTV